MPKEKDFNGMPFGRQIEHFKKLQEFKETAKRGHLGQKRKSTAAALKEFIQLYNVVEYYFKDTETSCYRDDSLEIFYKSI